MIKKFKQFESLKTELRELVEVSLVSLLDNGYNLDVGMNQIIIHSPDSDNRIFNWVDIKDHFIPFLTLLDRRYSILEISIQLDSYDKIRETYWKQFEVSELLELDNIKTSAIYLKVSEG